MRARLHFKRSSARFGCLPACFSAPGRLARGDCQAVACHNGAHAEHCTNTRDALGGVCVRACGRGGALARCDASSIPSSSSSPLSWPSSTRSASAVAESRKIELAARARGDIASLQRLCATARRPGALSRPLPSLACVGARVHGRFLYRWGRILTEPRGAVTNSEQLTFRSTIRARLRGSVGSGRLSCGEGHGARIAGEATDDTRVALVPARHLLLHVWRPMMGLPRRPGPALGAAGPRGAGGS